MVFSSLPFICFFLPAVFVLHLLIRPVKARNLILAAASLVFYAWGEPLYVLLLLASALVNYFLGRMLARPARWKMALGVVFNIGLLALFKYAGFFMAELNRLLPAGAGVPVPELALPIGISFYTFQILSYLIDVCRGEVKPQKDFLSLLLYISFFPQLIAGPIVKYHDVEAQLKTRTLSTEQMSRGLMRFIVGLSKKVLIANGLAVIADTVFSLPAESLGAAGAWAGAVSYLLQLYFDFSGYSDMAIGLGSLFGFRFKENFNYPFISSSCSEFWRRWHISLNSWFREYLYIPLGGNRRGSFRTFLNLWIVFFLTGLWHGAAWTFVIWGLFHGFFIVLERFKLMPLTKNRLTGTLYTLLVMLTGFIFFRADTPAYGFRMIAACFGYGTMSAETYGALTPFAAPYYLLLLGAAVLLSTPLFRDLAGRIRTLPAQKEKLRNVLGGAAMLGNLALLLLCLMQLATDSYNPFIYFRF